MPGILGLEANQVVRDPSRIGPVIDRLRAACERFPQEGLCGVVWRAIRVQGIKSAFADVSDDRLVEGVKTVFGQSVMLAANGDGRDRLLALLKTAWDQVPHWRFCQLLCNLAGIHGVPEAFYVEDDELERRLEQAKASGRKQQVK